MLVDVVDEDLRKLASTLRQLVSFTTAQDDGRNQCFSIYLGMLVFLFDLNDNLPIINHQDSNFATDFEELCEFN